MRGCLRPSFPMLLAIAGGLVGCQFLFERFEVGEEPSTALKTLCASESYRCVGPWLYRCSDDLSSWMELDTCASDAHCDSGKKRCLGCVPETHRCNEQWLEVCDSSGSWTPRQDCGSPDACHLNSDSCRSCTVGEWQCNEDVLVQCQDLGAGPVWTAATNCPLGTCQVADDRQAGSCGEVACDVARNYECDAARLLRCAPSRERLVEIAVCESGLCNADAANAQDATAQLGACQQPCTTGALRCSGAELQTCNGTSWDTLTTCPSAGTCSSSAGACQSCQPDAFECSDGQLRRCGADGQWQLDQDCGLAQLCNAGAGQCEAAECPQPGQTICEVDGLYRCRDDQSAWQHLGACDTTALCNANNGNCDAPVCARDSVRCFDNAFQRCREDLTGWDVVEECATGQTCSLRGCSTEACNSGSLRCNHLYLEICENGAWQRRDRCQTPALCNADAGQCDAPICGRNQFQCLDSALQYCLPGRDAWDERVNCADDGLTCNAELGACVP